MSGQKNKEIQDANLSPFEAALASLRPRTDRLDARWRGLLAKQAAGGGENSGQPCDHPAGHRFVCVHCGSPLPTTGGVRRWCWPAAAATMTSVAALLLVLLTTGHSPTTTDRPTAPAATGSRITETTHVVQSDVVLPVAAAETRVDTVAAPWQIDGGEGILTSGGMRSSLDFQIQSVSTTNRTPPSATGKCTQEKPLTNYELLRRLLHRPETIGEASFRSISDPL